MNLREITRRLHLSRNTVRAILRQKGEMPLGPRQDKIRIEEDLLRRLYADCRDGSSAYTRSWWKKKA
jgi:hypothetical protein